MFPPSERYYRCFRCFTKFTPDDEPTGTRSKRSVPESVSLPDEERPRADVVDTHLELEAEGTKFAVEEFAVTVKNRRDAPIRVTQVLLTFDGGEEKAPPKDEVVVPPGETGTVDIPWDWIHPDQDSVRIDVRSGGKTVATTGTTLPR